MGVCHGERRVAIHGPRGLELQTPNGALLARYGGYAPRVSVAIVLV